MTSPAVFRFSGDFKVVVRTAVIRSGGTAGFRIGVVRVAFGWRGRFLPALVSYGYDGCECLREGLVTGR
jgi:hypothetical protein